MKLRNKKLHKKQYVGNRTNTGRQYCCDENSTRVGGDIEILSKTT